jgi:hypothetical protein
MSIFTIRISKLGFRLQGFVLRYRYAECGIGLGLGSLTWSEYFVDYNIQAHMSPK